MELSQITPFNVYVELSRVQPPFKCSVPLYKVECVYSVTKPNGTVVTNRLDVLNGKHTPRANPEPYRKKMNKAKKINAFTQQIKELERQKALAETIITLGQQIANQNVALANFQKSQENLKVLIQNVTAGLNNHGGAIQQKIAQLAEGNKALQEALIGLNQNQQDVNQKVNGLFSEMKLMVGAMEGDRAQANEILVKLNLLEQLLQG